MGGAACLRVTQQTTLECQWCRPHSQPAQDRDRVSFHTHLNALYMHITLYMNVIGYSVAMWGESHMVGIVLVSMMSTTSRWAGWEAWLITRPATPPSSRSPPPDGTSERLNPGYVSPFIAPCFVLCSWTWRWPRHIGGGVAWGGAMLAGRLSSHSHQGPLTENIIITCNYYIVHVHVLCSTCACACTCV